MKTTNRNHSATSGPLVGHAPTRVVVLSDHGGESFFPLMNRLSGFSGLELHVVDLLPGSGQNTAPPTVIPPSWDVAEMKKRSAAAQALWQQCGPGNLEEQLLRYSLRMGTSLAIVQTETERGFAWWRGASLAETLAQHMPVLALSQAAGAPFHPVLRFRWLVLLDGSASAETVLEPLRHLSRWLPSDISLLQPLPYSQLWKNRVGGKLPALLARRGVSVAESHDYLRRIADREFAGACSRLYCVSGRDAVSAALRTIESAAVDGVAMGLSNRSWIGRRLRGEFNELIRCRISKPYLLSREP